MESLAHPYCHRHFQLSVDQILGNIVLVGVGNITENWESATLDSLPWNTNGDSNWYIDSTVVYGGNYTIKSGNINDSEKSNLEITGMLGASGNITFYKKISSEDACDFLRFYIDTVLIAE